MRQRKKKNLQRIKREETQNASVYQGKHESGEQTLYNPPLHPSSHVFSLRHWKQRFGGDKLKYFISDVTNARCSYRVTTTTTTNFIENWKITDYITFPPANSFCQLLLFLFQDGQKEQGSTEIVSPSWIWKCIKKGRLVPVNKFLV